MKRVAMLVALVLVGMFMSATSASARTKESCFYVLPLHCVTVTDAPSGSNFKVTRVQDALAGYGALVTFCDVRSEFYYQYPNDSPYKWRGLGSMSTKGCSWMAHYHRKNIGVVVPANTKFCVTTTWHTIFNSGRKTDTQCHFVRR